MDMEYEKNSLSLQALGKSELFVMSDPIEDDSESALRCRVLIDLRIRKKARLVSVLVALALIFFWLDIEGAFETWLAMRG